MSKKENSSDAASSDQSGGTDRYRTVWEGEDQPSVVLIEAVAAATDREPTDVPLLQRSIDLDALDTLLRGADGDGETPVRVSFTHDGVDVTVGSDGEITVRPPGASPDD